MKIPVEEQYKFVKLTLPDGSKAEGHVGVAACLLCTLFVGYRRVYASQWHEANCIFQQQQYLSAAGVRYPQTRADDDSWRRSRCLM